MMTDFGDAMLSSFMEALSFVWMELAMFIIAVLGYTVFVGQAPFAKSKKHAAGDDDVSPAQREEDFIGRKLQSELASGNHQAVFKLWQRLKSLDGAAPNGCLPGVVRAMQRMGKSPADVLAELRSALDCNAALAEGLAELLESLKKNAAGNETLISGVTQLLEDPRSPSGSPGSPSSRMPVDPRLKEVASALRQCKLDDALAQLEVLSRDQETGSILPQQMLMKLLSLIARDPRLQELVLRLKTLDLQLTTQVLDELLREAGRRKDATMFRQLYLLAGAAGIPKRASTLEALFKGLAFDAATLRELFEELRLQEEVPESLWLAALAACATCRDAKFARALLQQLHLEDGSRMPATVAVLGALIRALASCELFTEACDVYESEMQPHGMSLDSSLGSVVMKAATQAGRAPLAQSLVEQAPGDLQQHVTIIKACGRKQDLSGAKRAFDRLQQSGAPLSPLIYNCLLDACIQCGDLAGAEAHFSQMKQLDYADVVSYNTILKAHLQAGRSEEAHRLLSEMADRGLPANKVTYNELLNARVVAKDRRGMWRLVEDMKGAGVKPNAVTCSILLKALTEHSHATDMASTMELLGQMEEPMDEVLFSSVIEACIRTRRLDLLSDMMRRYAKQGGLLALTAPTYGSMIKAYGQARDVERLWELWNEMIQREVKPTAITLGCMVDALVKNSCVDDAWQLVHTLLKDEHLRSLVNTVIYSTVLKGFAMSKQSSKVFTVYAEMRKSGVQCNTISYNTMLDACARCGSMERVPQLLEDMKAALVEPDIITYSTLVKGYCLSGDLDRAFSVLEEMKTDGKFAPDEILYNSLLDGCAKQHRVEEALRLLEQMRETGVTPSNFTLSIMVKLMGRSRRLNQAFAIIDDLCAQHGFRPNIQVYTCLIQACIHNRQMDRALALHDTMIEESGCQPDEKLYSVLARGCMQAGLMQKAAEVIRCAYRIPGHNMATPKHKGPCGVEPRLVDEVVVKLNAGGKEEKEVAQKLVADLKDCRGAVQDTVYAQVVRQAASGGYANSSPKSMRSRR